MDVRTGCLCKNACFFQDLEGLTEVFGRMSGGISGPKLPLWAEFSFLSEMTSQKLNNRCGRSMRLCVTSWVLSFLGGGQTCNNSNVQHRFAFFVLLSFLLFCSP